MLYIALLTGLITGLAFYCFNKADQRIAAQESAPPGPGLGLREAAGTVWYESLRLPVLRPGPERVPLPELLQPEPVLRRRRLLLLLLHKLCR